LQIRLSVRLGGRGGVDFADFEILVGPGRVPTAGSMPDPALAAALARAVPMPKALPNCLRVVVVSSAVPVAVVVRVVARMPVLVHAVVPTAAAATRELRR